jgi:hypothetical protein
VVRATPISLVLVHINYILSVNVVVAQVCGDAALGGAQCATTRESCASTSDCKALVDAGSM